MAITTGCAGQPALDDVGPAGFVRLEGPAHPGGEFVGDQEPGVVPGAGIPRARVAETDDQETLVSHGTPGPCVAGGLCGPAAAAAAG